MIIKDNKQIFFEELQNECRIENHAEKSKNAEKDEARF